MYSRISFVPHIRIIEVGTACVFEIGDSEQIKPSTNVIAVQREKAIFLGDEFNFNDYSIFSEEIPQPFVYEKIEIKTENESPFIHIQNIDISSVAASSIVQIGSSETIRCESRVKHIRHLLREK